MYNEQQIQDRWKNIERGEKMLAGVPEKFYYIDNCTQFNNQIKKGVKKDKIEIALNITL